jgi:AcrR family transcriptional regulator
VARPRKFTDDEIISVTQRCILTHGPGVSTTVIAEAVGMSQAALFKRFQTKERLIIAALCQPPTDLPILDMIRQGPGPRPIEDQLIAIGTLLLALFRNLVPCISMMAAAGIDTRVLSRPDSPAILGRKAWTQWFEAAQAQGRIRKIDSAATAVAFIGMLQARPFRELIIGDNGLTCSDQAYVTQVVHLLYAGMQPEAA